MKDPVLCFLDDLRIAVLYLEVGLRFMTTSKPNW